MLTHMRRSLACSALSIVLAVCEDAGLYLVQVRAGSVSNASITKPHIVFVVADDMGWNGVGYNGKKSKSNKAGKAKTPTIDKLAKGGVTLSAYYAAAFCSPSRFAFLTGRAPWKSESGSGNFLPHIPLGTSPAYTMLPQALKKAGYKTHLVGKWHQGFHKDEYMPRKRGFDTFFGILGGCSYHFTQQITREGGTFECKMKGRAIIDLTEDDGPDVNYTREKRVEKRVFGDDMYRDRAVELIQSHDKTKPFFLYLSLQAPHEPYEVPDSYSSKYSGMGKDEKVYWGMHSHVDDSVKAVYDALNKAQMYSNTVFVFASDNGAKNEMSKEPFSANFPLRGYKSTLYDGGIRVPCFVTGGALPESARGKVLHGLMGVEDWYATLGHLTGAPPQNSGPSSHDSINNWAYISGASADSARTEIVQHYLSWGGVRMTIFRTPKYKAVTFGTSSPSCDSWIPDCKECTPRDPCVYDMETDPGETTNVANTVKDMLKEYMIPRMDASWDVAFKQDFFGTKPEVADEMSNKACKAFTDVNGYVVPWASKQDENSYKRRLPSQKMKISQSNWIEGLQGRPVKEQGTGERERGAWDVLYKAFQKDTILKPFMCPSEDYNHFYNSLPTFKLSSLKLPPNTRMLFFGTSSLNQVLQNILIANEDDLIKDGPLGGFEGQRMHQYDLDPNTAAGWMTNWSFTTKSYIIQVQNDPDLQMAENNDNLRKFLRQHPFDIAFFMNPHPDCWFYPEMDVYANASAYCICLHTCVQSPGRTTENCLGKCDNEIGSFLGERSDASPSWQVIKEAVQGKAYEVEAWGPQADNLFHADREHTIRTHGILAHSSCNPGDKCHSHETPEHHQCQPSNLAFVSKKVMDKVQAVMQ